jgi:hypothetical protein
MGLGRLGQEFDGKLATRRSFAGHALKLARRLNTIDTLDLRGIERQAQIKSDPDSNTSPQALGNPSGAQTGRVLLLHRHVDEPAETYPFYPSGIRSGRRREPQWCSSLTGRVEARQGVFS